MIDVQLYIENNRIDLFDDETITRGRQYFNVYDNVHDINAEFKHGYPIFDSV